MKKCPKCPEGKGIIPNYIHIDGGVCYTCNGRGLVPDNYVKWTPTKQTVTPQWVIEKENKTMKETHEIYKKVIFRIKGVVKVDLDEASDIKSCFTEKDIEILSMSDNEFEGKVREYHNEYLTI